MIPKITFRKFILINEDYVDQIKVGLLFGLSAIIMIINEDYADPAYFYVNRYCSNQYPNVEFYTLCNWCLREEGSNPSRKEAVKEGYSNMNASNISSSSNNDSNDIDNANREVNNNNTNTTTNASSSSTSSGVKLHRLHFSSQFDNPIKKPRILNRSASDVTDPIRSTGEISPRLSKARQVFKAKVRRYKLLEEVSS